MRAVATLCRELSADRRPDGELLDAFLRGPSEDAFVELIRRHGPLVWGACRRLLPDPADAEDAFQAAFLVLVRRARRLTSVAELGPWLHRVAVWTARNVRRKNARRLARQGAMPEAVPDPNTSPDVDLKADLDAALLALPSRYRESIILCHLQGFTRREAAARLGCAEGTLSAWLSRGLEKLRHRLRGLDPAQALAVPAVAVPSMLAANTASAAVASSVAAASVPPAVHSLVEGVLHMFWVKKATAATVALFAVFTLGVGVGVGTRPEFAGAVAQDGPARTVPAQPGAKPAAKPADPKLKAELERLQAELAETQALLTAQQQVAAVVARRLQKANDAGNKAVAEEARAQLLQAEAKCAQAEEECHRLRQRIEEIKSRLTAPAAPARDLAKEIAKLEEIIRATEIAHKFATEGAAQAKKRVELVDQAFQRAEVAVSELADAKATLARFQANADVAVAKLKEAQAQLAALKAKADEKPAKPERPKTPGVLDNLFGNPAELEQQLREARIVTQRSQVVAEAATRQLAVLQQQQGKPQDIQAAKAEVDASRAAAEAARHQMEMIRQRLAAAKAVQAPPLKALGACIEVVVIGGETGLCRVREYGRGGKLLGAVITEDAPALELVMARAMKDAAGPRDLWLTVAPEQSPAAILQTAEACKKAGFTKISTNGTLPEGVKLPLAAK